MDEGNNMFDLLTLSQFIPEQYLCRKCLALWTPDRDAPSVKVVCDTCLVRYCGSEYFKDWQVCEYLAYQGLKLETAGYLQHAQSIANRALAGKVMDEPPNFGDVGRLDSICVLYAVMSMATQFIHVVTDDLEPGMADILTFASYRVPVRCVIASETNAEWSTYRVGMDLNSDRIRITRLVTYPDPVNQTIIVVDGLVALLGPKEFSVDSWVMVGVDDAVSSAHVITELSLVTAIHNAEFAHRWKELSMIGETLSMTINNPENLDLRISSEDNKGAMDNVSDSSRAEQEDMDDVPF